MTNEQKYILQLIEGFTKRKGRASCYAFAPVKVENIIITFINLHRQKRQDTSIFIVTRTFDERVKILDLLNKYNLNNKVTILSQNYIKSFYDYKYDFTFLIGYNNDYATIANIARESKFILNIFTEYNNNGIFNNHIENLLPILKTNITFNDLLKDRMNYPVEEEHISVDLSEDDRKQCEKYDEYISSSMAIFGDFKNADKCRIGDVNLNISAGEFRYMLAKENGWSETLDMSIEFNKEIDNIYNPNSLFERASTLYNIIRERSNLLSDNNNKLPAIIDIINNNRDKKILIVSKRGEFANYIANYINDNTEYLCGEYHDCIPEQYINDENGKPIVYKSGENKGKAKLFKSKALSTMCLNRYNSSDKLQEINLLSIKNSSDIELKTAIDLVIFTSSFCNPVNEFINRFSNIEFKTNPLKVYVIYSEDTKEENELNNRPPQKNVKIIESEKNIQIDEENGAVHL